jgi:hypothetical protein
VQTSTQFVGEALEVVVELPCAAGASAGGSVQVKELVPALARISECGGKAVHGIW